MDTDHKERFLPTRRSLLERLKAWDDQEGWKRFYETYWQLIYGVGRRAGLNHSEAEDLVQDTVIAVAKKMPEFEYDPERCRFKNWLLMVTRSRLANLFRKINRRPPSAEKMILENQDDKVQTIEDVSQQLDAIWEEEWKKNLMEQAIRRVKQEASIEQFQIFDLFVLKGMDGRKVASTLGVSMSKIYVTKHRLSKMVRTAFKELEKEAES